ncbi:tetratricopeptide repeat protein [Helicobacter labacensis]|uniref:tetratricopeptide repeat protein n=1 Tax=Helicobacter labacensis TaxID=2316079 RepID=UPI000EB1F32E|nr:tetratricopeptide repeat protein [Helicobacter labacensis]
MGKLFKVLLISLWVFAWAKEGDVDFANAIRAWEYGDGHTAKIYFYKLAKMGDRRGFSGLGMLDVNWWDYSGSLVYVDRRKIYRTNRIKYKEALQYFQKAADMGDGLGFFGLGYMYFWGHGVLEDKTKAQQYFQKACQIWEKEGKEGNVQAYVFLGRLYAGQRYYRVIDFYDDPQKSAAYFKKVMEMGDPRGYFELGEFYNQKKEDARESKKFQSAWEYEKKAEEYYREAADLDYAIAYYRLTRFIHNRDSIHEYLQQSADMGYRMACYDLGYNAYYWDRNMQEALKYFNKACTMGDYESCYYVHKITGKDPTEPVEKGFWDWLRDLF